MVLVCWATASVMILASAASLDSGLSLWHQWKLRHSHPGFCLCSHNFLKKCIKNESVCIKFNSVLNFRTSVFEALVVLVIDDLD